MPFLPATASFPQSRRGPEAVRAGTKPVAAPTQPAWAKPHVSWPFLVVVPLAARNGDQGPASFTV